MSAASGWFGAISQRDLAVSAAFHDRDRVRRVEMLKSRAITMCLGVALPDGISADSAVFAALRVFARRAMLLGGRSGLPILPILDFGGRSGTEVSGYGRRELKSVEAAWGEVAVFAGNSP